MKVLVIAAHPDDEILGCGATMAQHRKNGDEVVVAILAEGITSREKSRNRTKNEDKLSLLAKEAKKANDVLGVSDLRLYDFPDNRMDSVDLLDIVKVVEELIEEVEPNRIYTHHLGDVNIDHRCIHQAVITACRPIPGKHRVKELLFFEVQSSTEWQPVEATPFLPNWFVDVTETIDLKLASLNEYTHEMRPWPHSRSIKASLHLAALRGSSIGVAAAEAFMVGRKLEEE